MSVTTLSREVRKICGEPRRGRPSTECSEILRILRSSCAAKKNHTMKNRVCRPKLKAGRPAGAKPKAKPKAKPASTTRRTAPKAKSASMAKRTIKQYTPGARSMSRNAAMPALPKRSFPKKIVYCPNIKFTSEEIRFLRNPMADTKKKASLRGRCTSRKNVMGRKCAVRLRTGSCVTKM